MISCGELSNYLGLAGSAALAIPSVYLSYYLRKIHKVRELAAKTPWVTMTRVRI